MKIITSISFVLSILFGFAYIASAASTPTLLLTNNTSTVTIAITGADPNATVNFYYPNISANNSTGASYTSIDIGQTNSNGFFSVSVSPNSYGLNGGASVYVAVDGVNSATTLWPATTNISGQTGSLNLSQQNVTLVVGQTVSIYEMNTTNTMTVQSNSNPSVVMTSYQSTDNSIVVSALNTGTSTLSICASTLGCSSVIVSVQSPTQTITFSQSPAYAVLGQPNQTVSIYGPGSGYYVINSNQNIVTATISGTNLILQPLTTGQVTLSVCSNGWLCGSLLVNSVSSGTAVPNQVVAPPPVSSDFSKPPQLTTMTISSNNVLGSFFGSGSTISVNFNINQTVKNVQVKVAGQQVNVGQGNSGTYSFSYTATGQEVLPLPVVLSYTNPSGFVGQIYFWIGNTSTLPVAPVAVSAPTNSSISSAVFTQLLSLGSTGSQVKALQQRLKDDGLYTGPITGTFGSLTEVAVKKYQAKHSLEQLGIIGPGTRTLLNKGI